MTILEEKNALSLHTHCTCDPNQLQLPPCELTLKIRIQLGAQQKLCQKCPSQLDYMIFAGFLGGALMT
jgi:hypothetical protein